VNDNPKGQEAFTELLPGEIVLRPELFQPREFSFGLRQTDPDHVKKLARAIGIQGELDPVLVIKLGKRFVCVDGHHRLEAYKKEKWTKPIKCEWFGGSLREAVDESMARNAKDRLNVPQADRLEAASTPPYYNAATGTVHNNVQYVFQQSFLFVFQKCMAERGFPLKDEQK
jgi:ParB/Sulfiredoxin domain